MTIETFQNDIDLTRVGNSVGRIAVLSLRMQELCRQLVSELTIDQSKIPMIDDGIIKVGNLTLISGTFEIRIADEPIPVTPVEFKLLHALMANCPNYVPLNGLAITAQVMQPGKLRNVKVYIRRLRKKLDSSRVPWTGKIESKRSYGYRAVTFCQDSGQGLNSILGNESRSC